MTRQIALAAIVLAIGVIIGWRVEYWRSDRALQTLRAEHAAQAAQAARQALSASAEAQRQHESNSARLRADLAATRTQRDAALRGLRAMPIPADTPGCPAGAADPRPDAARAGADRSDRADARDPDADALREAARARSRAVMYNALLAEYRAAVAACERSMQ